MEFQFRQRLLLFSVIFAQCSFLAGSVCAGMALFCLFHPFWVKADWPGSVQSAGFQHQGQYHLQAGVQAAQIYPFLTRMGPAAFHRADGVGHNAQRQRNIAVGGTGGQVRFPARQGADHLDAVVGKAGQRLRVQRTVAGAHAQQLRFQRTAAMLPVLQCCLEFTVHLFQTGLVGGTEFVEQFCLLGNGIYRGAAFDAPYVVGGAGAGRRLNAVEFLHQAAKQADRVGVAKVAVRVSARCAAGNTVAIRTHRVMAAYGKIHIKGIVRPNTGAVSGKQGFGSVQVAQPFLTGVGYYQNPTGKRGLFPDQVPGRQQKVYQVSGIIPDTGGKKLAPFFTHGEGFQVGKDDVGVGGKNDQVLGIGITQPADHVFGCIDVYLLRTLGQQPVPAESSPQVLLPGGGRYFAQRHQQGALFRAAGIVRTRDLKTWERLPNLVTKRSPQQRNVDLLPEFVNGKYAFYTRPMDDFIDTGSGGGIGFGLCEDITHAVIDEEIITSPRRYHTITEAKNGEGATPIKTEKGWLHIAHGVRNTAAGLRYVVYLFVTDLKEPWKVIAEPSGFLIAPRDWERVGDVSNVVFTNGAIAREDGSVYIYYAASDTRLHVATTTVDKLLDFAFNTPADPLRSRDCVAQRCELIEKNLAYLKEGK